MNINLASPETKRLSDHLHEKYDLSVYKLPPNTRIRFFQAIPTSSKWGNKWADRNSPVPYKVVQIMARSKVQDILRDFEHIHFLHVSSLASTNWPCPKLKSSYPNPKDKVKNCYLLEIWRNTFCIPFGTPGAGHVPSYMITIEGINDFVFFLD